MVGDDGTIKIKAINGETFKILHENDLKSRFQNFRNFKFEQQL